MLGLAPTGLGVLLLGLHVLQSKADIVGLLATPLAGATHGLALRGVGVLLLAVHDLQSKAEHEGLIATPLAGATHGSPGTGREAMLDLQSDAGLVLLLLAELVLLPPPAAPHGREGVCGVTSMGLESDEECW